MLFVAIGEHLLAAVLVLVDVDSQLAVKNCLVVRFPVDHGGAILQCKVLEVLFLLKFLLHVMHEFNVPLKFTHTFVLTVPVKFRKRVGILVLILDSQILLIQLLVAMCFPLVDSVSDDVGVLAPVQFHMADLVAQSLLVGFKVARF